MPIRQRGSRPILLVGNHQTMADLGFLADEFLREYDTCVRGLAHPVVSRAGVDENSESRSFEDMMRDALKNTPAEPFLPRREPKPLDEHEHRRRWWKLQLVRCRSRERVQLLSSHEAG